MPTEYTKRLHIFCTTALQTAANQLAKDSDPSTDLNTFSGQGYSATGNEPATHYACSWQMKPGTKSALETAMGVHNPNIKIYDNDSFTFDEALSDMGLQAIEPDII